jgi:UDP-N-acetylglucosamine 2-epimerase (non-hydrolysing)
MAMSGRSVMIVAGTRPEVIKLAPVIWSLEKLGVDYIFIWSGQHFDYEMSRIFFEQLRLPEPDEYLNIGFQSLDVTQQVEMLIHGISNVIKKREPKYVYALGDTNTVLASALASVYMMKPFIHDEAGMRSFDLSMLEEVNRKIADSIASFRLSPTKIAALNLLYEGIPLSTIRLVGSTVVDTLLYVISRNLLKREAFEEYDLDPLNYILITIHRRENLTEKRILNIISILIKIATNLPEYKIIFPIHPHTRKKLQETGLIEKAKEFKNILLTKPFGHLEFITLLKGARVVVTDSGGVQEEAFLLGKKIVTLREITEWPETVILGYNHLASPDNVVEATDLITRLVKLPELEPPQLSTCPLGDGNSGWRIAKLLKLFLENKIKISNNIKGYPLPKLKNISDHPALCFKNGQPFIYQGLEKMSPEIVCLARENLTKEEMLNVISVNWMEINKIIEEERNI